MVALYFLNRRQKLSKSSQIPPSHTGVNFRLRPASRSEVQEVIEITRDSDEVKRHPKGSVRARAQGTGMGSVRFGAIVTSFQTSLRASRSARQILTAPGSNVSTELLIPASLARALTEPHTDAALVELLVPQVRTGAGGSLALSAQAAR